VPVCIRCGAVRLQRVQAPSGINRPSEPPRSAIASQLASPARCQVLSPPGHGLQTFPSLCWDRAEGRGLEPRERSMRQRDSRQTDRGNAGRSTPPAPQSKPVTAAPCLVARVAPSVDLRAWAEGSWPQGQLVFDSTPISGACVDADPKCRPRAIRFRAGTLIAAPTSLALAITRSRSRALGGLPLSADRSHEIVCADVVGPEETRNRRIRSGPVPLRMKAAADREATYQPGARSRQTRRPRRGLGRIAAYGVSVLTSSAAGRMSVMRATFMPV
jgi:hypothetical protein